MRLLNKNSIQYWCLRILVFSIVLRHSNYDNRIICVEGTFFGGGMPVHCLICFL